MSTFSVSLLPEENQKSGQNGNLDGRKLIQKWQQICILYDHLIDIK